MEPVDELVAVGKTPVESFAPASHSAGPALNTESGSSQQAYFKPAWKRSKFAQQYVSVEQAVMKNVPAAAVSPILWSLVSFDHLLSCNSEYETYWLCCCSSTLDKHPDFHSGSVHKSLQ